LSKIHETAILSTISKNVLILIKVRPAET